MPQDTPRGRPDDPGSDEPLSMDLPGQAGKLKDKLHSLGALDGAIRREVLNGNDNAARQLSRIAREHALEALDAMLECVELPAAERGRFSVSAIHQAEQFLEIEPETFASFFAAGIEPGNQERKKALKDLLVEVRDSIRDAPVDAMPSTKSLSWLPAVLRIGSAVLVATVVGAPLAALAVGESIVVEVTKAGITVTACTIAAEWTNRVLQRWLTPPVLAEPIDPHASTRPLHEPNDGVAHDLSAPTPDDLAPESPAVDGPEVLFADDLAPESPDWQMLDDVLLDAPERPEVDDLAEPEPDLADLVDEDTPLLEPPVQDDLDEPHRHVDDPFDDFDF